MGCIFRPEALSWEDIDGGRGELTLEAIRNFISEYCYQRHRFQLGNEDRRVRAELQRNGRRQRADLDRDGVHRRHAEAFLHRDKRTDLFVQHHRRRVGEAVERVPYAENRCGGQLRRKRDPDVYVHEK